MKLQVQAWAVGLVFALVSGLSYSADSNTLSVVKSYMAQWNKHDPAAASKYFAADGEFIDASVGVPQVGPENARDKVIGVFIKAVPDMQWKMIGEPIVQGDNIAFEWQFDGNNTGAWDEKTPATNKHLTFKGVSFMRLQDGKIKIQHDYYDALSFNKQLGW